MSQLEQNTANLQAILDLANSLPEAGGGSAETCWVTVAIPECSPLKYFPTGGIGIAYVDPDGGLMLQENTASAYVTFWEFDPVECKCGTPLTVTLGISAIASFAKNSNNSDEISDPVMISNTNYNTMATFMLPETPGIYTIFVYYGT